MTPALRAILFAAQRPTIDFQFLGGAVDSRITVSGGSNGTVINSSGVIVAASAPRIDYNPSTLAVRGLLFEDQRTNLLLNSLLNGTSLSTQSVTVTAQAYTLSFYGTGTVTLSGTFAGSLVGSGAYPTRSTLTFTPTAGTLTATVTGSVQFANLEAGSFASSFIPTAAATVTRTQDSATVSGTNFSSWFNPSAMTFLADLDIIGRPTGHTNGVLILGGTAGSGLLMYNNGSTADSFNIFDDTNSVTSSPTVSMTAGNIVKQCSAFSGMGISVCTSGNAPVSNSAYNGHFATATSLTIGGGGGSSWNGHFQRIRAYRTDLPASRKQALTT